MLNGGCSTRLNVEKVLNDERKVGFELGVAATCLVILAALEVKNFLKLRHKRNVFELKEEP